MLSLQTSAKVSPSLKLHILDFPMFVNFFQLMNITLKSFNNFNKSFNHLNHFPLI